MFNSCVDTVSTVGRALQCTSEVAAQAGSPGVRALGISPLQGSQ